MGQQLNYAAVKDAKIRFRKEECAVDMGQGGNCVAVKDAQIRLIKEECV